MQGLDEMRVVVDPYINKMDEMTFGMSWLEDALWGDGHMDEDHFIKAVTVTPEGLTIEVGERR